MNKVLIQQIKPLWPWAVFTVAAIFVIAQLFQLGTTSLAIKKAGTRMSRMPSHQILEASHTSSVIEATINAAAKQTKITRLLSINTQDSVDGPQVQVEAEASPISIALFLHELQVSPALGACSRVHVMGSTGNTPPHVALTFSVGRAAATEARPMADIKMRRNVFAALWQEQTVNANEVALAQSKQFEEQQRKEQARLQNEQQARAADEQITAKRRELESGYVLTGIVNDGKQAIAFVSRKSTGGTALMLRQDDTIGDARVARIDEKKGEMQLDYQGKFQLLYHINEN